MKFKEERKHLCVLCRTAVIIESRNVETTDAIPDQCNCDLNRYEDLPTEGGRILKRRPYMGCLPASDTQATSPSGLCTACLARPDIALLIPHIEFEK